MAPLRSSLVLIGSLIVLVSTSARADIEADPLEDQGTTVAPPPAAVSPVPAEIRPGSRYGYRSSPRTGRRTFHAGVDFLSPRGTPVFAASAGVVEAVAYDTRQATHFSGYGNSVVIRHGDGRWSFYAHLHSVRVEEGQTLAAGEQLGEVGNSTNGRFRRMPTHLHFEVRRARGDGRSPFPGPYRQYNLDPLAWLASIGVTYETRRRVALQTN